MRAYRILDLLYPRRCVPCGRSVGDEARYLCWDCLADIMVIQPPYCQRCGNPISGRVDHEYECHGCTVGRPHFDLVRSAARYDGALRKAIQVFKYNQGLWMEHDLLNLLEACVRTHFDADSLTLVLPVPLHRVKLKERGFNQSHLLAAGMARRLHKPFARNCLYRIRYTQSQTRLTADDRATNVSGAFWTRRTRRLNGQRILLVDDVITTGATVNECAKVLKKAGAKQVNAVSLARG